MAEAERAALRRKATQLAGRDSTGEPIWSSAVADLRQPNGRASELAAAAVGASPRQISHA
jgi:hypothetical protein